MKKVLSLFLCFSLLLCSLVVFSSCGKFGEKKLDFSEYVFVYDCDSSESQKTKIGDFVSAFNKYTGLALDSSSDDPETGAANTSLEILIGNTNREETQKALKQIKGDGYAISLIDKKLVLVGTTDLLTAQAMSVFTEKYLAGEDGGAELTVLKKSVCNNMAMLEISPSFRIIYSYRLDSVKSTNARAPEENVNGYDYGVVAAGKIHDKILSLSPTLENGYFYSTDLASKPVYENEITVGVTQREETTDFIAKLDATSYGYRVKDGKIAVIGLADFTLRNAVNLFNSDLIDSVCSNNEGNAVIRLPADYSVIREKKTGFQTDFPRPTDPNVLLTGSADVGDDSIELYYTGSGISSSTYLAYCKTLEDNGYTLYQENEVENSIFRTYTKKRDNVALQVSYSAYAHAEEQRVQLYVPCFRIVSCPMNSTNLIPQELLTPDYSYSKVTETKITAMKMDYGTTSYGTCYVITLEDGTFVVVDGGMSTAAHAERLFNILRDLYYKCYGKNSSTSSPIPIAAWYLTHLHGDHYGAFAKFCQNYGKQIRVKYAIMNFPSDDECYNCYDPNVYVRDNFDSISGNVTGGMRYLKVHTGQIFYLANAKFEVMFTHEDIYPWGTEFFNNTSTIIRNTFYTTNGAGKCENDGTTMLWLGDLQSRGSRNIRALYGNYIKSDMVQVAHHGSSGCEYELYALAAPTVLWWPHSLVGYSDQTCDPNSSVASKKVDWKLAHTLDSLLYTVLSDGYNTTITIGKDGPDIRESAMFSAGESGVTVEIGEYIVEKNS